MTFVIDKEIIRKLDVSGPRYTSYPTAPNWESNFSSDQYIEKLKELGQSNKTISLYFHLPFCQSLCSFCGCNVIIRKQEDRYGDQYIEYLFKEIDILCGHLKSKMTIRQFHFGGGTPTFLSNDQLERLMKKVSEKFIFDQGAEVAIEIDPRTIDHTKLIKLRDLGFNRISLGVQDFNAQVQNQINRIQPFEQVEKITHWCRELGFSSINFDLIYGLPKQTEVSFVDTIQKVLGLKPNRIALYSFAYVPWLKKHQNKMKQNDFPDADEKLNIFLKARELFLSSGYQAIAMDHFALKNDELSIAYDQGVLYRNFMGYTVKPADEYIGLGVTSIGFLQKTFIQNHKTLKFYFESLDQGNLPVERGMELGKDDVIRQWVINSLMCRFFLDRMELKNEFGVDFDPYFRKELTHLKSCQENNLLIDNGQRIELTSLGKLFVRNVCMGFDVYLKNNTNKQKFSQTV